MTINRRKFIRHTGQAGAGMLLLPSLLTACGQSQQENEQEEETSAPEMFFKISLAEWSLHKALFGGEMTNLDFPRMAKETFGIEAVEYVNQFFKDKAEDQAYLSQLKQVCDDLGVVSNLIMIDGEGHLGHTDDAERLKAVENHYKWVQAAKFLGCFAIRVNAAGEGTAEEVKAAAVDGLGRLSEYAAKEGLSVIVENHGGYSSNGKWMASVIESVNMDNCGTLPDFGNFCIQYSQEEGCTEMYDRYQGVKELMPYAKAVSAKSHDFDEQGNEIHTDYRKMMQIVKDAGYTGYVGIEYEGSKLSETEGIIATKKLLEKVGRELSST